MTIQAGRGGVGWGNGGFRTKPRGLQSEPEPVGPLCGIAEGHS